MICPKRPNTECEDPQACEMGCMHLPSEPATWSEATITVNGTQLTFGQSMTVRVALESFALSLAIDGLGDDEGGKHLVEGYTRQIQSIRTMMHRRTGP
jgi:hypothetical protein